MSAPWYEQLPAPTLLADLILVLHTCIVIFVLGGVLLTVIGGIRQWRWIRNGSFRLLQLLIILIVVVQSLRGRHCPLTYWEMDLRRAAGQSAYDNSFIQYWLSQLIYYQGPLWLFNLGYGLLFLLVLISWWRWPPQFHRR